MRQLRVSREMRGTRRAMPGRSSLSARPRIPMRLVLAGVIVIVGLVGYFGSSAVNPVTGRKQHVDLSVGDEIAIGLQATPTMMSQYGGEDPSAADQRRVDAVGGRLLGGFDSDMPWRFEFHLLADPETVNAFALPGGQVFITRSLYDRLTTEGQLAGVLGHEVGHVIERHGAQRMAKGRLTAILVAATGVATDDRDATMAAAAVGQLVNMSYGRDDELESDVWGVRLVADAGYDPRAMIGVMEVLREAGGSQPVEFFSTHPNPDHRIERIQAAIDEVFPSGVPAGLVP